MYPVNFNQVLVIGTTIAGIESRKVTKTKMAFPMAAVFSSVFMQLVLEDYQPLSGHCCNSRILAMFLTVGVFVIWLSVDKANTIKRPPDATKSTSAATNVKKILSRAIVIEVK